MTTFGNSCTSRIGGAFDQITSIITEQPAPSAGVVTSVCVYCDTIGAGSVGKVKVFRLNGSNYDFIGESSSQDLVTGTNTFSGLSISILTGDYIAVYINTTNFSGVMRDLTVGSVSYRSGDITTNTPTSEWTDHTARLSVLATYTDNPDVYVNSSTGNDSNAGDSCTAGHPVQTFGKAYSLLASGGTVHVCNDGADFSGETVTLNKSFSIDRNGSAGLFYMPKAS